MRMQMCAPPPPKMVMTPPWVIDSLGLERYEKKGKKQKVFKKWTKKRERGYCELG